MTRLASLFALTALTAASGLGAQAPAVNNAPLAPLPAALPRTHTPSTTSGAINSADLKTRLYIFADDSMGGREVGTIGNVKGTDYIAAEVKKIGLKPAGENGTYFQTIPLKSRTFTSTTSLRMSGGDSLALYTQYLPLSNAAFTNANLPVIYAGHEGESTLTPSQVVGKLVVFAPNPGQRSFPRIDSSAASALIMLDMIPKEQIDQLKHPEPTFTMGETPANQPTLLFFSNDGIAKLFGKPVDSLKPGDVGKSIALAFSYDETPARYPGRNVVAILPGSDPKLAGEYVAVGAHNDHIGMIPTPLDHDSVRAYNHILRTLGADEQSHPPTTEQLTTLNAQVAQLRQQYNNGKPRPDSIFNGADDDGSGSMSVLEIAQHLAAMKVKPKRSILFVWHVGEEKGLWGSMYFTENPTVPRDSIVTQLNIDMIGRGDANDIAGGNPNYLQLVGSRRLSTELGDAIEKVNADDHHGIKFDYTFDATGHPQQIYCRSDHYSYARWGIPVTFFTTGGHPDYHQVTDEPEYIDYEHMARVANFISDVAVHVANLDHRPVVDHPKPDPHGACIQ